MCKNISVVIQEIPAYRSVVDVQSIFVGKRPTAADCKRSCLRMEPKGHLECCAWRTWPSLGATYDRCTNEVEEICHVTSSSHSRAGTDHGDHFQCLFWLFLVCRLGLRVIGGNIRIYSAFVLLKAPLSTSSGTRWQWLILSMVSVAK